MTGQLPHSTDVVSVNSAVAGYPIGTRVGVGVVWC